MQLRLPVLIVSLAFACAASDALAAGDPIMPLSQVAPGMRCTSETVIHGTAISGFDVEVIDVVRQNGAGARILVRVSGPAVDATGIAEGFSGSPVYCPDSAGEPRNIGAISESVGEYGNKVALVTPIEDMLGEPVRPPSSARALAARARPLVGPLTVSGLSPWLVALVERSGSAAGRAVVSAPADPLSPFGPQPLVPGASVATMYSEGGIALGAIGTVTYLDGERVYAFGHELDGAGRRALLLQDAYVYDVVSNPNVSLDTSYKLAAPAHTEGTLTSDTPNAVVGQLGAAPKLIPVDVMARDLDSGHALTIRTNVADETDIGLPLGTSPVDSIAALSVAQAATQIFNGAPASQSGSMCFRVDIHESPAPLRFCNRYVGVGGAGDQSVLAPPELASAAGADVANALALLDNVQFATLHVDRVFASLDARRGLAQASIVSATGPSSVSAGHAIAIRLTLRVFRGRRRTVSFRIVPPRAVRGPVVAVVSGPANTLNEAASGGASALAAAITSSLTGGAGAAAGPVPDSLAALHRDFARIGHYDGLRLSFSGRRGSVAHAYRDPQLLITGRAMLRFLVR